MELVKGLAEQRVLLQNVSWETYERLIFEHEERPVPRFFYDRGAGDRELIQRSRVDKPRRCAAGRRAGGEVGR